MSVLEQKFKDYPKKKKKKRKYGQQKSEQQITQETYLKR